MRHYIRRKRHISLLIAVIIILHTTFTVSADTKSYFEKASNWAIEQGIVVNDEVLNQPCTKGMLAVFLWVAKKMPQTEATNSYTDANGYILMAEQWAVSNQFMSPNGNSTFGTTDICTREQVAVAVWKAAGCPENIGECYFSDIQDNATAICWSGSKHIMDGFTETMFSPYSTCTARLAATAVYRAFVGTATREWFATAAEYWNNGAFSAEYDGTASYASDITREQFVSAVAKTWQTAHLNGYIYGNSTTLPPTNDGIISCDRLIAKALWDLGFTDQTRGGITLGNMIPYLQNHGFSMSNSFTDIGYGSIVIVKGNGKSHYSHTFVTLNFDASSISGFKFDCGSNSRIQSEEPVYEGWGYRTDDILVFNIPE